ncbi:hypothetical protein QTP86_012413 [Hemibagrus guttatus]|nr:hypothetical protein QTP86_012413 [Hemibagrus guttatus]
MSSRLREVHSIRDSDVIIAFVPVVFRAGTDIQAALNKIPIVSRAGTDIQAAMNKIPKITRCFDMVLGNTMDSHKTFMENLTISSRLREVHSINDSDVIIAFVPVVSRAGLDAQAAMNKIPKDNPVVLVMLHHTFNPDAIVPDVRSYVDRKDVFVVDCLFHEDQGLLRCPRNDDAIRAVKNHLIREDHSESCLELELTFRLQFNKIPKDKPVVLVMLHHTFNPDAVVPDVRSYVDRKDVFVVDCLFHEDQGLLRCPRNDDAIRAVKNHLIREDHSEVKWTTAFAIGYSKGQLLVQFFGAVFGAVIGVAIGSIVMHIVVPVLVQFSRSTLQEDPFAPIQSISYSYTQAGVFYTDNEFKQVPLIQVTSGGQRSLLKKKLQVCESQKSFLKENKEHKGPVQCVLGSSHGPGPRQPKPCMKNLGFGTWNITSLQGKEPELVREVERHWLEIVRLASMRSLGCGTQLLERGWTLFYSGMPHGERHWAGVGLLIAPQLSRHVLEFSPVNKRVVSLHLRAGDSCLTVVSAYGPNSRMKYPTFLETLRGVLEGAPTRDSIVLLMWATTVIPGGA